MSRDTKLTVGAVVIGFLASIAVFLNTDKTQVVYVTKEVVVAPTASPSAAIVASPAVRQGLKGTIPSNVTIAPVKK